MSFFYGHIWVHDVVYIIVTLFSIYAFDLAGVGMMIIIFDMTPVYTPCHISQAGIMQDHSGYGLGQWKKGGT